MSSATCHLVQPIHKDGVAALRSAGLEITSGRAFAHPEACVAVVSRNLGLAGARLEDFPALRVIGVHGVGTDAIDLTRATALGIAVVNTPGTNVRAVAEHAMALLFTVAKQIVDADAATRGGDFAFKDRRRLVQLEGLRFGVVGFGRIGQATARLAAALGLEVVAVSRQADAVLRDAGVRRSATLASLLAESDVVSLHLPGGPLGEPLIGRRELASMKPTAILINTGRGVLVDEIALADALVAGTIAGAGLDVFTAEPMPQGHPLLAAPHLVLTPHSAGSTEQSLRAAASLVSEGILDVLTGRRPRHLVNPEVWPRRHSGKNGA